MKGLVSERDPGFLEEEGPDSKEEEGVDGADQDSVAATCSSLSETYGQALPLQ